MLDLFERAGHYSIFDGLSLIVLLAAPCFALFAPARFARRSSRHLTAPARIVYRALTRRHRSAPYLVVFFVSLAASFAVFARVGEPVPAFHDEFSYLLAADTFAHGRLTNPTPVQYPSFETFQELMQPTYMSKYPPGPGLMLALGQAATGFPIVGAWITVAFAVAATLWMLRAVLPARWAFWGTVLLACHPQIIMWATDYWGGGVALAGGALVMGGAVRIARAAAVGRAHQMPLPFRRTGAFTGLGVSLLVMSRPFEGGITAAFTLALLCFVSLRSSFPRPRSENQKSAWQLLLRTMGAALVPLSLTAVFYLIYNRAVTSSALTMPYLLYMRTFESYPPFRWWPAPTMPTYHSPTMDFFYRSWARNFTETAASPAAAFPHFAYEALQTVLSLSWRGGLLGLTLFVGTLTATVCFNRLPLLVRGSLIIVAVFWLVLCGHFWLLPHYAAPIFPATLLVSLAGLRLLVAARAGAKRRRIGSLYVGFVLPVVSLLTAAGYVSGLAVPGTPQFGSYFVTWNYARAALQAKIASSGGKHLVFVQYRSPHAPDKEWVFNGADFDTAPVLWAHSLGAAEDAQVQKAYPDRKPWFVIVTDAAPPEAVPYFQSPDVPK